MQAALYTEFGGPIQVTTVPDPAPAPDAVVVEVKANGICRSDWHGWQGHDDAITALPHVPGHEWAGVIVATGRDVTRGRLGDRVTAPFVGGCGRCPQCLAGQQQICDHQFQPGFTHWGSFAEYVEIKYADENLVRLPDELDFVTAASLGCRFITAFRAVADQGRVQGGDWLAVHGCGGVGLSAIMIGAACGAQVIAVDISEAALALARQAGATAVINGATTDDVPAAVRDITGGGAHVSLDALGSRVTCINSILNLRKQGRHVQVGLMAGQDAEPRLPMGPIIANELEIVGSHGMQAHRYPQVLAMIAAGRLRPDLLIQRTVSLREGAGILMHMADFSEPGVTVIDSFG
ncbi:MAG: zinc-dependent alcohol dehydrogenase family protein [Caldilineaceae bacterium]|nr:zinc-dependent alcohol dehydrogenase family protein [Caldilineaceae bacterium]